MELQVINTLNSKRKDIEAYIGSLERDLDQARRDLSAVLAAIKVFMAEGPRITPYMHMTKVFPRHELPKLCTEALAAATGPISTTEIAIYIMRAKGLDDGDRHLRKAICYKAVQVLRMWEKRKKVVRHSKVGASVRWQRVA